MNGHLVRILCSIQYYLSLTIGFSSSTSFTTWVRSSLNNRISLFVLFYCDWTTQKCSLPQSSPMLTWDQSQWKKNIFWTTSGPSSSSVFYCSVTLRCIMWPTLLHWFPCSIMGTTIKVKRKVATAVFVTTRMLAIFVLFIKSQISSKSMLNITYSSFYYFQTHACT